MAQDAVAVFHRGGRGLPTAGDARLEELVGVRYVTPDGDRRQASESGGIEDEDEPIVPADDDVMRIFVLDDDRFDIATRALREAPTDEIFEHPKRSDRRVDARARVGVVGNLRCKRQIHVERV